MVYASRCRKGLGENFLTDRHGFVFIYARYNLVPLSHRLHFCHIAPFCFFATIKNERLCLIKEDTMCQIAMDTCQSANLCRILSLCHRIDSILDMVVSQNCVALLMDAHITQQSAISWCALPIVPVISSQLSLCYRSDRVLSKTAQLLLISAAQNFFNPINSTFTR